MNTTNHIRTRRGVGDLNRKLFALFMSVLLAITCLPIIPGNVKEAQAETPNISITGYAKVDISMKTVVDIQYTSTGRLNRSTINASDGTTYPVCNITNGNAYRTSVTSTMATTVQPGIYSDPGCTNQISAATGTNTVPITNATAWNANVAQGSASPYSQSPNVRISDLPVAPVNFTSVLGAYSAGPIQGKVSVGGTVYNVGSSVSLSAPAKTSSFTWPGTCPISSNGYYYYIAQNGYTTVNSQNASGTITVTVPVTYTDNNSYNPIVTNSPNLYKNIGDAVTDWAENITATWGYTTSRTIPSDGQISDDSLTGGTDTDIANAGGTVFDKVGVKKHDYTIEDEDALDPVTPDGTFSNTSRNIVVLSLVAPQFVIKYASGAVDKDGNLIAGNVYAGEWTNQPLDMDASHSDPGTYETVIRKYDNPTPSSTYVNAAVDTANAHSVYIPGYQTDSADATGNDFTSIIRAEDPMNPGTYIDLSPESVKQNVKIDTVDPTPDATYSGGTFTDASTDVLSGIDATRQKIALVGHSDPAPVDSAYDTFAALNANPPAPGHYDVYVWAWDNAGNNAKNLVLSDIVVLTNQVPTIAGETAGPDTYAPLASGTWTNQDVKVTVTPPVPEIGGTYYSALYDGATQEAKAAAIQTPVDKTYTAEIPSLVLHGTLVDAANAALSNDSATYEVKIDKTDPTPIVNYNAGTPNYGFTDMSTDTTSPVGANSGVDASKTEVAIIACGGTPAAADFESIATAEIPATGYYDVWTQATDNAGNVAAPVLSYSHISRSGVDEIDAVDFAWDIASGSAALDDAMARMLSHVEGIPYGSAVPFPSTSIDVDATQLAAIHAAISAGQQGTSWPLTFSTPAGPTSNHTTIMVTLFDHGPDPAPDPAPGPLSHDVIYGNDFSWGISTGLITNPDARVASQVTAYDKDGNSIPTASILVSGVELANINAAILAGQKDTVWPLTFESPDGTQTTVQVTLYDNGPATPPAAGDEMIVGNDFAWGISSGSVSFADAYFLAHINATSATGASLTSANVSADSAELADINAAIAAGQQGTVWPLTFTTDGASGTASSTTVLVTLYDNGPTPPVVGNEHVVGNNFNWGISTGSMTDADALILSNALATSAQGTQMDLTHVSVNAIELADINAAIAAGQKGTVWPLTLDTDASTGTPASATVYVTLFDNGPANPPAIGSEHIVGNDFNWGISTGDLDEASAKILSLVTAKSPQGVTLDPSQIQIDATELAAINDAIAAGQKDTTWPLTFTTSGATGTPVSTTVQVSLFDNGPAIVPAAGAEHIVGNDIRWGISSGAITDAHALSLSKAAGTASNGIPIPSASLIVDATDLAAINDAIAAGETGAVLPLKLSTDGATGPAATTTIMVTLYDAGPTPHTPGDPHIVANHFSWHITKGNLADNDAKQLSLAAARAADATEGQLSDVAVDPIDLAAINAGVAAGDVTVPPYPLTLTYTDPATSQVATCAVQVTLLGETDLSVEKSVDKTDPLPGEEITYTIKAKNNGNAVVNGLWIKDYVPEYTTFVSCDAMGTYGATVGGKEYVNWYIPSLAAGAEVTLTMKVKVNECNPGTVIENIALYEDGIAAFPSNPDDDPMGGQTNPATSTVGNAGGVVPSKAWPLPRTGDFALFGIIGLGALALLVAGFAIKRRNSEKR